MLHKILLIFWRNYFRYLYGSTDKLSPEDKNIKKRIRRQRREKDPVFVEYEKVCKFSHLVLDLIVRDNKQAISVVTEIDLMELLLDQISTPWTICLKALFKVLGEKNAELAILQRNGIKGLVDQLHSSIKEGNYNAKILELLSYICSPGKKTDRRIQDLVLEMVIGRDELPD